MVIKNNLQFSTYQATILGGEVGTNLQVTFNICGLDCNYWT